MNRREHLEPRRWKASYTKHKRAFLLISVFKRQKKTHFLKCSSEILCFEVVKEFRMWDKGETLAWSEDNSLFLQGLGLNCRECWHSAQAQLPQPQHLLEKVELETCALHSLLIITLPASTIVHGFGTHKACSQVLLKTESIRQMMNVENSSLRGFDWGCIWSCWQRTLLLFFVGLCPASGQSHSAEGRTMLSRDAPLAGDSLSGWQCLLLDYISSCFDMTKLRISSMCSLHSVSLPVSALLFQQQRLARRRFKLNIIQARNCANHSRSPPCSVCRHCWQIGDVSPVWPSTHMFSQQMGEWGFSCTQRQHGVADWSGLGIRKYCQALSACWQRMSRPVFAYIHLSWLGMFKNVVVLH